MKKTLSTAGLGNVISLDHLALLANENGFEAIDIPMELTLKQIHTDGAESVCEIFEKRSLVPGAVGMPVSWGENVDDSAFEASLEKSRVLLPEMRKIGVCSCTTYLMPGCDGETERWYDLAASRIAKMNQVAEDSGFRFGVEYVAPKHLIRMFKHPFVHTMKEMLALIRQSGCNAGLLLDSIHWFSAGETVSDLMTLSSSQIVHVHLNDSVYQEPIDNDRVYPGEGRIPLRDFLGALKQVGYKDCIALEVLTPVPVNEKPEVLAKRASIGFEKVWPK